VVGSVNVIFNNNISPSSPVAADTFLEEGPDNIEQMMSETTQLGVVEAKGHYRLLHAKSFCKILILCIFLVWLFMLPKTSTSSLLFLNYDQKECKNTAKEKQESKFSSNCGLLFVALVCFVIKTICSPVLDILLKPTELAEEKFAAERQVVVLRIEAMLEVLLSVIVFLGSIRLKYVEIYSCIDEEEFRTLVTVFEKFVFFLYMLCIEILARVIWEHKWCIYWWNWNDDAHIHIKIKAKKSELEANGSAEK
jgi:hypothetical protein